MCPILCVCSNISCKEPHETAKNKLGQKNYVPWMTQTEVLAATPQLQQPNWNLTKSPRDINKTKWLKKSTALDVIFVHHQECNMGSVTVNLPFKGQTIP